MNGFWLTIDFNHIYFSTARSMARYGLLMMVKGNWNGQPVLTDTSYFNAMTNSSQNLNLSYGYLTWLNGKESYMMPQSQFVFAGSLCPDAPDDMYSAMGKNGQLINVVPSQGLVMIRMGNAPDNQYELANYFNNLIWQHLNNVICNTHRIREQEGKGNGFRIFPNPASSLLNILPSDVSKSFTVRLFDMSGHLIFQGQNTRSIDITGISPNEYILEIKQGEISTRHLLTIIH